MIVAKLNGKELPAKPAVKWFKGKWLELGTKSGARFSFKESHDTATNVRTPWRGEGVGGRAGGCAGPEGENVPVGAGCIWARGVHAPASSQGQGCGPPEVKIVQAWEETAGPSRGDLESGEVGCRGMGWHRGSSYALAPLAWPPGVHVGAAHHEGGTGGPRGLPHRGQSQGLL